MHRRLLWFGLAEQAVQVLPLFLAAHLVSLVVRMLAGGMFPGWELLLAPLFEALLWPVVTRAAAGAAAPRARSGRESAAVDARHDRTARTSSSELDRFRGAPAGGRRLRAVWLRRCWARGWCYLQVHAPRGPGDAGRGQPHRGGADRAQPRPASSTATAWCWPPTTRPTRWRSRRRKVGDLDATIDELAEVVEIAAARPPPLQAPAGREQELRVAADPHQAQRRGGGALHGAALPLPRRGHQGAAVPQLPAGRDRQPPAGLHRPHQPGREEGRWRTGRTSSWPTTAAPNTSASSAWSRATRRELHGTDRLRGGRDQRRRPRRAPPEQPRRRRRATRWCCPSTSSCRRWWKSCSATAAARWWRIDPRNGEVLAFVSKPTFDPNLFVDGIDVESWRELNESHRQAAAEPRAARHLPAGLDLQALHGDGGAEQRQAQRRARIINDGGTFTFGNHALPQPRRQRPGAGGHAPLASSSRATSTTTRWPTRWAWT